MKKGLQENGFMVPPVAILKRVEASDGQWPKMLALVNHIPTPPVAYAMRFDVAYTLYATKVIFPPLPEEPAFGGLLLLDYITESKVCDAHYIKSFRIRLQDGIAEADVKRLGEARCWFTIDGDPVIKEALFRDLIGGKEITLPKMERGCSLFHAHTLINPVTEGRMVVDGSEWIGYMAPNGSLIQVKMNNVPMLETSVQIEIDFDLVNYTTKP